MNEAEWRESADPGLMLSFLAGRAGRHTFWLFALACCRRVDDLIVDGVARAALDGLQALASHDLDGPGDCSEALAAALKASDHAAMARAADGAAAEACAAAAAHSAAPDGEGLAADGRARALLARTRPRRAWYDAERHAQAGVLRTIINPFRRAD